jgi:hypothetical protein
MKPLSKKEIKYRTAEENTKKNKKRDFRKLANQLFKNPTDHLPLITHGLGNGSKAYCYHCKINPHKVKVSEDKIITCQTCGNTAVEFRDNDASIWTRIIWKYKEFIYGRQHKK